MGFGVGCNTWYNRDETALCEDLALLAQSGMNCLRVFPVWSDFQPAAPIYGGGDVVHEEHGNPIPCKATISRYVWYGYCHLLNYSNIEKTVAGHTILPFDTVLIKEDDV